MKMYAVQDKANIGHVCGVQSILPNPARSSLYRGRVAYIIKIPIARYTRKTGQPIHAALLDVSEARHTIQSRLSSSLLSVRNAAFAAALGFTLVAGR